MINKIGLLFSHMHVRGGEEYKFDILEHNINNFRKFQRDFYIIVSGHGIVLPKNILDKIDECYWENTIDKEEIGRGHPKFCKEGYKRLTQNNINKSLKLRFCDFVQNENLFYELLEKSSVVLTEQTSIERRMIGDLLMFGNTRETLALWNALPWDYSKSGLYNLYDNAEYLAMSNNLNVLEYLKSKYLYVSPEDIGWYSYENNWNHTQKTPFESFTPRHLWGKIQNYSYYGGHQ